MYVYTWWSCHHLLYLFLVAGFGWVSLRGINVDRMEQKSLVHSSLQFVSSHGDLTLRVHR